MEWPQNEGFKDIMDEKKGLRPKEISGSFSDYLNLA